MKNNPLNVICYKTKKPVYYNKGTKWEKTCDTFLLSYTYRNNEETQALVDQYNKERPARLFNPAIDDFTIDDVDYFFMSKQEEMY